MYTQHVSKVGLFSKAGAWNLTQASADGEEAHDGKCDAAGFKARIP